MSAQNIQLPDPLPKFLTVPQVAALLQLAPRTIYDLVSQRRIPFRKIGSQTRFERDEILDWTKGEQPPAVKVPAVHYLSDGALACGVKSLNASSSEVRSNVTCKRCLKAG